MLDMLGMLDLLVEGPARGGGGTRGARAQEGGEEEGRANGTEQRQEAARTFEIQTFYNFGTFSTGILEELCTRLASALGLLRH